MSEWTNFVLEHILLTLIAFVGIFANILAFTVLRLKSLQLRLPIRILLMTLSVVDGVFLALVLTEFGMVAALDTSNLRLLYTPYVLPILQIILSASVWTTVAISIERYMTVCKNYRPSREKRYTIVCYIVPIVVISILFNIPRFFQLESKIVKDLDHLNITNVQETVIITNTEISNDPVFFRDYLTIANFVVLLLVPFTVLITLNTCIAKAILRARPLGTTRSRRREDLIAVMLMVIVILFLVCHTPRFVLNLLDCLIYLNYIQTSRENWFSITEVIVDLSHLALVINSSINLLIYVIIDKRFRKMFSQVICCQKPEPDPRDLFQDENDVIMVSGESVEFTVLGKLDSSSSKPRMEQGSDQTQNEQEPLKNIS